MTEEEWMALENCEPILWSLVNHRQWANGRLPTDRKLLLLGVAVVRETWPRSSEIEYALDRIETAVDVKDKLRKAAFREARWLLNSLESQQTAFKTSDCHRVLAPLLKSDRPKGICELVFLLGQIDIATAGVHFNRERVCILRDIFGNPFRPVAFDPDWQTSTAVGLARTMYDARDFGAMPIFADALQDAGCEDAAILSHCRDPHQVHVRGCWAVDLVLGKQ